MTDRCAVPATGRSGYADHSRVPLFVKAAVGMPGAYGTNDDFHARSRAGLRLSTRARQGVLARGELVDLDLSTR
jgi:hypothetical protein